MHRLLAFVVVVGCTGDDKAGNGHISVVVSRDARPVPGAPVILHGAAGDVRALTTTDEAGRIEADLAVPAMVTVGDPAWPARLVTITDVIGDTELDVPLGPTATYDPGPAIGTLTIDAPSTAAPVGTAGISVHTPCGTFDAPSFPVELPLYSGCATRNMPVMLVAFSENISLEDPGVALAYIAGSSDALSRWSPGAWSKACTQALASNDETISMRLWPRLAGHTFRYVLPTFCSVNDPPAGYTAYAVAALRDGVVAEAGGYVDGSPMRWTNVVSTYAALPNTIALDPLIGIATLDRFEANTITWTRDSGLSSADAIDAKLEWSVSGTYVQWQFVMPGDVTELAVPELPADVQTWGTLADATSVVFTLRYFDASWTDNIHLLHDSLPMLVGSEVDPTETLRDYRQTFYPR